MAVRSTTITTRPVGMMGGRGIEGGRFAGGTVKYGSAKLAEFRHLPTSPKASLAAEKFTIRTRGSEPRRGSVGGKAYDPEFGLRNRSIPETQRLPSLPRSRIREGRFNPLRFPEYSVTKTLKPDVQGIRVTEMPNGKKVIERQKKQLPEKARPGKVRAEKIMADLQRDFPPVRKPEAKPVIVVNPRTKPIVDVPVIRVLEKTPVQVRDLSHDKKAGEKNHTSPLSALRFKQLLERKVHHQKKASKQPKVMPLAATGLDLQTAPVITVEALQVAPSKPKPERFFKKNLATVVKDVVSNRQVSGIFTPPEKERRKPIKFSIDNKAVNERIKRVVGAVVRAATLSEKKSKIVEGSTVAQFADFSGKDVESSILEAMRINGPDGSLDPTRRNVEVTRFEMGNVEEVVEKIVLWTPPVSERPPGKPADEAAVLRVTRGRKYA